MESMAMGVLHEDIRAVQARDNDATDVLIVAR
jgi:hypothetical protein